MNDIVIKDLSVSFGEKKVLNRFSAVIGAGSVSCIMAASGAGKTTLLSVLQGFIAPDSGSVTGNDVRMSAVFQEDRLCESLGAIANVRLGCGRKRSRDEIVECLTDLGIGDGDSLKKPVRDFSGGMKRRVAIARALLAEHELLFLDEPFKGLDPDLRALTAAYILDRERGKTVVAVTHDQAEADLLGARIIRLV